MKYQHNSIRVDKRWYYMAPALLDGPEYVSRWISDVLNSDPDADPEHILANMRKTVNKFVNGAEQFDDLTMMCFEYKGMRTEP